MMRFVLSTLLVALSPLVTSGIFSDQANEFDFALHTAGGAPTLADFDATSLYGVSSQGHVSARSLSTGDVIWRTQINNINSNNNSNSPSISIAIAIALHHPTSTLYSIDGSTIAAWDSSHGHNIFSSPFPSPPHPSPPQIVASDNFVVASVGPSLSVLSPKTFTTQCTFTTPDSSPILALSLSSSNLLTLSHSSSKTTTLDPLTCEKAEAKATSKPLPNGPSTTSSGHTFSLANNFLTISTPTASSTYELVDAVEEPAHFFPFVANDDKTFHLLVQTKSEKSFLYSSKLNGKSDNVLKAAWTAEESLASVLSVLFFDELEGANGDGGANAASSSIPSFGERMQMQLASLTSLTSNKKEIDNAAMFGLNKRAAVLTSTKFFILHLSASGEELVKFSKPLQPNTNNKIIKVGGQQVVLLSSDDDTGDVTASYIAIGTGDEIAAPQTTQIKSGVHKTFPLSLSAETTLLLLHSNNDQITLVPNSDSAIKAFVDYASVTPVFTHKIDEAGVTTFKVDATRELAKGVFPTVNVGEVSFGESENVVSTQYPEVESIQSPAVVLGDDSLLLKYLNPHVCVVVTKTDSSTLEGLENSGVSDNYNNFRRNLAASNKKPLGAGSDINTTQRGGGSGGGDVQATPSSVLYINLIDTVSSRLLHRIVLADAISLQEGNLPVVITENWVVYAYFNNKTKRQEIGSLSLYEGMLDKHGITAFKSPEQETSFSSFDAPKPIVLSKVFAYPKSIVGLGVSKTRNGITGKMILMSLTSDQVVGIDRRMLEPRRPFAAPKDEEKMEGLSQYQPILPFFPQSVVSYTQVVAGAVGLSCVETNLESQSLVLAWGGPDLFFSRLTPSGSFDLLPSSFNKPILVLGMAGILVLVKVAQTMGSKKQLRAMWA